MQKIRAGILIPLITIFSLSGCVPTGAKSASLSYIYLATAIISLVALGAYLLLMREKEFWFTILFTSVSVVNIGYYCLAISPNLTWALNANRLAYLGSVFLPLAMTMIILKSTRTSYCKWLPKALIALGVVVFFIAGSPGILDIYYKEVSFEIVNGTGTLIKVYGPLHSLYLFYLVGYFGSMATVVIRATIKKTMESALHAVIVLGAVFVNIAVWFTEQIVSIDFEMLSVSYIITETFLWGLNVVVKENQRLKALVSEKSSATADASGEDHLSESCAKEYEMYLSGLEELTQTEKIIYDAYVARATTKEIMERLNIKENTLKFHNKNIYSKLGVSSRKELIEIYKKLYNLQ